MATPQNQNVTNAVLSNKLDHITDLLKTHIEKAEKVFDDHDERLRCLENTARERATQVQYLSNEVNKLRSKTDQWNTFNSFGVVIGWIVGAIGIGK